MMLAQSPFQPFGQAPSGGGGSGNATVPNDAPIQPPQAFVDGMLSFLSATNSSTLNLANKSVTSVDLGSFSDGPFGLNGFLFGNATANGTGLVIINLSGNAISDVNTMLAQLVYDSNNTSLLGTLDLSGGTNAAPTGQGLTDKQTLIDAGWTVTTN